MWGGHAEIHQVVIWLLLMIITKKENNFKCEAIFLF